MNGEPVMIQGHGRSRPSSPSKAASPQAEPQTQNDNPYSQLKDQALSDETKKEVFSLAEKILAAAVDNSSGETEKKLIAAVMAVHMKYAESLHVIENLIQDRKKIDDRVKFLEGQLKKGSRGRSEKESSPRPAPPGYIPSPGTARPRSSKGKKSSRAASASPTRPKVGAPALNSTAPAGSMAGEPATNSDKPQSEDPSGGDQHMPLDESAERAAAESDCEDELLVIPEDSAGGLPPAYDSKAKRKPVDPLRARKEELKERLQQLNDMPPDTRGATPKTATSVREAFPSRPRTAPGDADAVPAKSGEGSGFGGLRRPSTASTSRRRTMSVKDEIEAVEQELHEIELKLRFKKASKVGPAEFAGMKERDLIMRKRAEDRLEKSRQLAEAAEKLKKEEAALQEKLALKRIEQACQSGGAEESWEQRLEREKAVREERKLKHKAAILAQRVPLTASIEESINIFKDIKGKNAPEPPKIKIEPIKAVDPETIAARIARDAEKLEEAKIKKEKANEERIRSFAIAPDHPAVVKMKERAIATKAKSDLRAQELKRKEEEVRAIAEREERERLEAIKAQKAPDVKPTNAQISRDLEVKRAEEARIEEQKRKEKAEEERIERQKELQRSINAAKKKDPTTSRVVLGEGGEPINSGGKQRPTLSERFDQYHKPHLNV